MPKGFEEALKDGFLHITDITDPNQLAQLRSEGIQIDAEGYHTFIFGPANEYELRFEPFFEDGFFYVALYHQNTLITEKIPIKAVNPIDLGSE